MSFPASADFLFVPHAENGLTGTLYELSSSSGYVKNSFVILPYQNPQVKETKPLFFRVKNKTKVSIQLSSEHTDMPASIRLQAGTSKKRYIEKVTALKEHIQQGNIYEINYCIRFYAENVIIDPLAVFQKLHRLAKAPYSMLFKSGDDYIISASPELFLKKEGDLIYTKPIKGTIRRGMDREEDEKLKTNLQTSLKERTENVMAVDVARNDLSMFAKKGTVRVNKLYNIETFETVHQMVSTVSCEVKKNTSFQKIIESTFPMASMTGAPKIRAMQLIDGFEDFERHFYSGAMGLIDENENFTLSVIIRSIFYDQGAKQLSIAVGGAITYLSDPEKEYDECLLKAHGLLRALDASII